MTVTNAKSGPELLEQAAADPTIDKFLDRDPAANVPFDYEQLVKQLGREREMFITAQQEKRDGKPADEGDEE